MKERKLKRPRKVSYEVIHTESLVGHPMYALLEELVEAHHQELERARIALAWCTSWKPDIDGRCTLGKCRRASDLDRELAQFDFVILLRKSFWLDPRVSDLQRRALLDHELCHAALKYDDTGDPLEDERGRLVWRTRKHDIEEFTAIVERYGSWTSDLERFFFALRRAGVPAYQPCNDCRELPGWVYVTDDAGHQRVMRCECFARWTQQLALKDAV